MKKCFATFRRLTLFNSSFRNTLKSITLALESKFDIVSGDSEDNEAENPLETCFAEAIKDAKESLEMLPWNIGFRLYLSYLLMCSASIKYWSFKN